MTRNTRKQHQFLLSIYSLSPSLFLRSLSTHVYLSARHGVVGEGRPPALDEREDLLHVAEPRHHVQVGELHGVATPQQRLAAQRHPLGGLQPDVDGAGSVGCNTEQTARR